MQLISSDFRITKILLENIRCFERIELNLTDEEMPIGLSVILGDNGVGKSTLLKSIALGLSSPKVAPALFEMGGLPWLRRGETEGRIRLEFNTHNFSDLLINLETYGERIILHECNEENLFNEAILICGYGASRRAFGDKSITEYSLREAVSSLFHYDARLQNPELILRRLLSPDGTSSISGDEVLSWIDNVLLLPHGSTRLGATGLEISGPWGEFTPIGALGDGYKATLAWILDFLGWVMYRNYSMLQTGIKGIVIVDEVEQHLHPLWQRRIYSLLKQQFPDVQFITTTHSPLCVIGTTDLEDRDVSIIHLRRNDDAVEAISGLKPPRGMRADQVLTSYLFGLETSSDNETKRQIEKLSELLSKKEIKPEEIKPKDEEEIIFLQDTLNQKLGSGETELERFAANIIEQAQNEEYTDILQQTFTKSIEKSSLSKDAVKMEIKRQFQDILNEL